jgi:hypothetical protein
VFKLDEERGDTEGGLPAAAVGDEELEVKLILRNGMGRVALHRPNPKRAVTWLLAILTASKTAL